MLDVFVPLLEKITAGLPLEKAAPVATDLAQATAAMSARAGRSSYIDPALLAGHPDPGAIAASLVVAAVVGVFVSQKAS